MASLNNTINVKADDVEVDSILKIPILSAVDRSYGGSRGDICTGLEDSRLYIHNGIEYVPVSDDTPIITSHNSMLNLQGGNSTERYHLTEAEHDAVSYLEGVTSNIQTQLEAKLGNTGSVSIATPSLASFTFNTTGNRPVLTMTATGTNNKLAIDVSDSTGRTAFKSNTTTNMLFSTDGNIDFPAGIHLSNTLDITPNTVPIINSSRKVISSTTTSNDLSLLQGIYVNGTTPTIKTQLDNTLKTNVTTTQSLIAGLQCGFSGGGSVSITAPTNYPTITVSNRTNSYACSVRTGGSTGNLEFLTGTPSSQALQAMLKLDGTFHSKSLVANRVLISSSGQDIISSTTTSNDLGLLKDIWEDNTTPTIKAQLGAKLSVTNPNVTGTLTFDRNQNRKLVLYGTIGTTNDHQYTGLSVESATLSYRTGNSTTDHIFYSGINATSSKTLMTIKGNGTINIPDLTASRVLTTDASSNLTSSSTSSNDLSLLQGIYIDGNTPTVKVQLDSKVSSTDPSFTGTITLNKTLGKKLILYEGAVGPPNAHQYIGTSVESSTTTYHVEKSTVDHLFVSGISAVLSKELLRVKGTGKINIPDLTAGRVLTTDATTNDLTSSSIKNSELETLSGSTGNIQASLINATYLMPCIRGTIKVRVVNGVLQPATVIYETAQVGYTLGTPVADTSKLTVVFSSSPLMTYIPYVSIQHVGYSYNRFNIEMVTTNYFVIRQINNSGNIQAWATSGATEEWFFDVEITKKPNP